VVAVLLALMAALVGVGAGSASAHSGGQAVVLVRDLTLTPAGTGWQATAVIVDFDSGSPIQQSSVVLLTGQPEQRTLLSPTSVIGQYQGAMPTNLKPGPLDLKMQVRAIPGSAAVKPYNGEWQVNLVAGETTPVVGAAGGGGGGGGGSSSTPIIIGVVVIVVVAAMLYGLFVIRRRSAVPAKGKPDQPVRAK